MATQTDTQADIDEATEPPARRPRRRRLLRASGAGVAIAAVLLGGLWLARKPIADRFISRTLSEQGVRGSYKIARIGPRTQRLDNLVLGDPANPDLTADWVEVDLGYGFSGVRVTGLRTGKVVVNARYRDGKLDLGAIDRLMGEGTGETTLPDIVAQLGDVRVHLETEAGDVDFAINGVGNLRSGFTGDLDAVAGSLAFAGCTLDAFKAETRLGTASGEVQLKGPVAARALACPEIDLALTAPRIEADLRTDPQFERISGAFALAAAGARQGERSLDALTGLVTVKGSAEQIEGSASIAAAKSALGFASTGTIKLGGNYAARPSAREQDYSWSANLSAENVRPDSLRTLGQIEARASGTPLAPLAGKLTTALRSASRANSLSMSGRLTGEGKAMQLLVNGARFVAASGARVDLSDGGRLTYNLPSGDWVLDGEIETGGGDLPEARLAMASRPDGSLAGRLIMEDYSAQGARLGLTPLSFMRGRDGALRFATTVSLDGPIGEGGVRGLVVPVEGALAANGSLRLARDCVPLRWQALRIGTVAFDPARLDLCGLGGSALRTNNVALSGKIGESQLALSADAATYSLGSGKFDLTGLATRIGSGENPVRIEAGTLRGEMGKGGALGGTFESGHAIIASVPFDLGDISGDWRFADSDLTVDGRLRLTDREADDRFHPLDLNAAHLTLADGRITASGNLVHPASQTRVAQVDLVRNLSSGDGQAKFRVDNLVFGQAVQPDELTPLALGVVANVEGAVDGSGQVSWSSEGVTSSTGLFMTRSVDFAAAFGPVEGLATSIEFTDLINLRTAPHQRLTVEKVSAGVDVFDGVIDYQLLSSQQARIEGGRWPFSGGTLELLPDILELGARQPRNLTFRAVGFEAGAFINAMQIENVSATGTFDGLFPMVFDETGGRIEGGLLIARQAGSPPLILSGMGSDVIPACSATSQAGTLSYVGPVSDAQLGTMGKLAFDALKQLGYKCLTVQLDGALDGEFVTQIAINGVNRGSVEARNNWLTRPFVGLPFIFNIRIEAPFRGLLSTVSSFSNPGELIRTELERMRKEAESKTLAVQPPDSEKELEGKQE